MGLSQATFGLHSFWIGAASLVYELGLPPEIIQRVGHWQPKAFKFYIHDEGWALGTV